MTIVSVPKYVLASITISLGGLLNGLDSGCIGGVTTMTQFTNVVGELSPFLLGFTVSLIMLTAALPSLFSGVLADRFGRLKIVLCGAVLFTFGAVLQGASPDLVMFLVGRAFSGIGEGVFLANIGVYICEIAPLKNRGSLAGLPQFMACAGVCFGYFICYGSVHIQSTLSWRLPYIIQASVGVALVIACCLLPESPRWYVNHGKREKAIRSLERLDFAMEEAQRDILSVTDQRPSLSMWQCFVLLFRKGYRTRTVLALFVLGMVQLSGIDGIIYYAPTIFKQAGLSGSTSSFLASGLSAILMLAISVPAVMLADRWGRRTSAISGGLGLSGCMLLVGSLYAAQVVRDEGIARWVVIACVFIFGLTFCSTWGIVGKIYASEIQPSHTRATANAVGMALSFLTNWLVAIVTPILLNTSAFGAYFLFGFLALGTVIVLAAYMPETRGRSLESIQEAFHHPAGESWMRYLRVLASKLQPRSQPTMGEDGSAPISSDISLVPLAVESQSGLR